MCFTITVLDFLNFFKSFKFVNKIRLSVKIFLPLLFLISVQIFPQSISDKYTAAMEKYDQGRYSEAYKIFSSVVKDYGIEDEIFASAHFYAAQSLLKMGLKSDAAAEFEFTVNNIIWSAYREEALYNLGLIYFDNKSYSLSRERFKRLIAEYPNGKYTGSALYWIGDSFSEEDRLEDATKYLRKATEDKSTNNFKDYSLYALATVYEKQKDYKNAIKYYDQLLSYYRKSPLFVSAQRRIGICYFYLHDYQSSILELNNPVLSKLTPDLYAESLYLLANSYYRVEQYADAEKIYSKLIDEYPGSQVIEDVKYGLAWSYFQQKKYNQAYQLFNNLSQGSDSLAIESFFWKAQAKRYAGQDKEAIEIFKQMLANFPASFIVPRAEYELGLLYFDENEENQAKNYLINSATANDTIVRARSYVLLGEIELNNENYKSAKNFFEPVLNLTNKRSDVYLRSLLGLAVSLYYLDKNDAALEYMNELLSLSPDFERDRVNYYLGEIYFKKGNYKDALVRFKSLKTDNDKIKKLALYAAAYSYFNLGDYDNAALRFNQYLKTYPEDVRATDVKLRLADSYFGSKNFASASRVYKQLFSSHSVSLNDPYTYYQFAQALYKSGKADEAINEFNKLETKFPNSKYADASLYTVGWINFQRGDFKTAIEDYRNVLVKYPATSLGPIVYYSIGDAYFNMSNYDSAVVNYQKVLVQYPSSNYVFDAVNGIQYSYVAKGKPEKAIDLIDDFVAQNPTLSFSDQIYFKKGEIYYSRKDYKNSEESYKSFIEKFPNSKLIPEAYYWIGKSAENLDQNEEAIFYFNTVFQKYPGAEIAASAVLEMGKIHNELNNYEGAINTLDEAITKLKGSSSIPEIMFMKGQTYVKMDSLQQAYEVFSDVSYYYRETIFADQAKIEMGTIDLAAGRYENSEKSFLEVAEKRDDDLGAKAQYFYALSLYEQDKTTDAISALVRIRTVFSSYDEWLTRSYLLLGDCYVKLNDKRNAEEMYRQVIAKHRSDAYGKEARDKIRKLK